MALFKSVICPVLIGRAAILDALDQMVFQIRNADDSPCVVVISGEAGVGKSRLVAEMKSRVTQQGWAILQGHCFELDSALPYAPLLDLLRSFCAVHTASEIANAFGAFAPELIKLLPDLNRFFPDLTPSPSLEPESDKRRLFHSLAQFFIRLVADQPHLIIIEDFHWSDDTSTEFILYLARQLAIQRRQATLLITSRSDEVPSHVAHFLAELDREHLATEFSLPRLSLMEVETMIRSIFDQSRPVRVEFLNMIYNLTEGNPFFIEEVLKALLVTGEIFYVESEGIWERKPVSELHVPRSVQDALRRRTERLSEAARKIMTLAAVAGRRFDFRLLQQLARLVGSAEDDHDESGLLSIIKELMNAQLVVEESADQFSFRHALTRQAIYSQLLVRERKTLHLQVAQIMEHTHADGASQEAHLEELAYHFYEAGIWDKALGYSRLAGEKALKLYASRQAIEQFTRALDAAQQAALELPLNLYYARGQAFENLDDFERARSDYQEVLDVSRRNGDRQSEWRAILALGSLWSGRDFVRGGNYFQQAQQIASGLRDPAILAHTLNRVGNWHLNMGRPFEALHYHEQALHHFEALQDNPGRAQTLDLLGITNYVCGDLVRGTACYNQSLALFRELNDRQGMINSMTYQAIRSRFNCEVLDVTSITELTPPGEMALEMARDMDWRSAETIILSDLAQCYGAMGSYGHALKLAQEALDIALEIQHPEWISAARWALGHLHHELFALPEAREQFELALTMALGASSMLYTHDVSASLATTFISQNDINQAEAILNSVLTPVGLKETWGQRLCRCASAELALAQGAPDRALQIVDRLITTAANIETHGRRAIPRLSFLRGQALMALDRLPEAEIEFQAARDLARSQGRRPLLWRIHLKLGALFLALGRPETADQEFSAARSTIEQMAATLTDEAIREGYLRHAMELIPTVRTASPHQNERGKFYGLTGREREVAVLVAMGKSNREIAKELVVSERTAATHVSNILNKLNYSSRAQIAAWAVNNGLAAVRSD